jgi:hypothetical protein
MTTGIYLIFLMLMTNKMNILRCAAPYFVLLCFSTNITGALPLFKKVRSTVILVKY